MDINDRVAPLKDELSRELTENILKYWSTKMVDVEHGGFYGRRDGEDHLELNADKGVILNTRILWTFSCAAKTLGPAYLPVASRAYHYLINYFLDRKHGGVFWTVSFDGKPVNTKKQIYAQAFAIYALAEYYSASRNEESLQYAKEIFLLIEKHSFDSQGNGYMEAFDEEWSLLEDLRLSDKDANEKKTMNTHLHVLEAYTSLFRLWPDENLRTQLRNLILLFKDRIINASFHFDLFFNESWEVKSSEVSYGHDIEGSWLLYEAAAALGDQVLMLDIERISVKMVDVTMKEGMDRDGAVKNELHDTDRHWWPQAEALVGLVNCWQLTGQTSYLASAFRVWDFIKVFMIDRRNGEWFWRVDESGKVNLTEDKAGPWKCPYHNGRAIFELLHRLK